jgi:hypothetical protein
VRYRLRALPYDLVVIDTPPAIGFPRPFRSDAALREALEGARPTTLAGAVGGPISASRSR